MKKCIVFLLVFLCVFSVAIADEKYVLVQDELNVRSKASVGSRVLGRLFTGDKVNVTKSYRGWCFLEGLHSEEGCGWISEHYVTEDPVTQMDGTPAIICANGRVAFRSSIDGDRVSWAHPGDIVHVYGTSDSWSVTDRGYVKTEYLVFQ